MNKPLKPATQILRGSPRLQRLLRQAESLSKLQALLYQHLAPAQREQLQLGGYDEGVLTLILADAAWATRLRYQQGRLLQQLRQHDEFSGLQHIRLKIRPASAAPLRGTKSAVSCPTLPARTYAEAPKASKTRSCERP